MQVLSSSPTVPVYSIPEQFEVYNFEGNIPDQSEMLIPHRKSHYLLIFLQKAGGARQWVDMKPYELKDNTIYFLGPDQIIVKEEIKQMWSRGIAFTSEFLSFQENASLKKLPIIQNPQNGFELLLSNTDVLFVADVMQRIVDESKQPGEWQQRMLGAYLTVLLTYLSRLYTAQYKPEETSVDKILLKRFQEKINEFYQQYHEVGDYAAMLHMSAGHLSDVVKIQSGRPAIKHIHDRLVMEARRLLFHTSNSLKDIAFELGFTDASYFNRFFKRETGVTPAGYRDTIRKMYH
jgi:AraC family transcriptional activator of pobA